MTARNAGGSSSGEEGIRGMSEGSERRQAVRRRAEGSGEVRFGDVAFACRVLDVSEVGAQIRIEGRRASRSLVGKRASLAIASAQATREARVVWARPAVAGVYLGLAFADRLGEAGAPVR